MMIRAADSLAEARRVGELAGASTVSPDFAPVARRIRDEATSDWDDAVAVQRLEDAGVTFVRGHGRLAGPGVVEVGDRRFVASAGVVVNTGTAPAAPPVEGLADTPFWTNREALRATEAPNSLIVVGGGAIGAELAQAFARFGSRVSRGRDGAAHPRPRGARGLRGGRRRLRPRRHPGPRRGAARVRGARRRPVRGVGHRRGRRRARADRRPAARGRGTAPEPRRHRARDGRARPVGPHASTPTSGCAPARSCGPSATSPARAPSRTCPCTRRASRCATSPGPTGRGPATTPCRGSPSPTRRWGRSG